MGIEGKIPFSWTIWVGVAGIAGFLAMLLVVVAILCIVSLEMAPNSGSLLERQASFLFLSIVLSLPALAHQTLMRQTGLDTRFYYAGTVIGGWMMLSAALEGAIFVDELEYRIPHFDVEGSVIALLAGVLVGVSATAFLQSLTLPRSGRVLYCAVAVPGALAGISIAIVIFAGLAFLARGADAVWIAALSVGVGWACIAAAIGWPIHRAIVRTQQGAVMS